MNFILKNGDQTNIVNISILKATRGIGGTLAYPIKINGMWFLFETDDEGNWRPFPFKCHLPDGILLQLDGILCKLEKQRRCNSVI